MNVRVLSVNGTDGDVVSTCAIMVVSLVSVSVIAPPRVLVGVMTSTSAVGAVASSTCVTVLPDGGDERGVAAGGFSVAPAAAPPRV
jgi:hypothetical protein